MAKYKIFDRRKSGAKPKLAHGYEINPPLASDKSDKTRIAAMVIALKELGIDLTSIPISKFHCMVMPDNASVYLFRKEGKIDYIDMFGFDIMKED